MTTVGGDSIPTMDASAWLTAAAECATDAMIVVDRGGRYRFANTAAEKLLGHKREEFIGRRCDDTSWGVRFTGVGAFRVDHLGLLEVSRTGEARRDVRSEVRREGGSPLVVGGQTVPVRDARGAVLGALACLREAKAVTERLNLDRQSDADLRAFLARSSDPVVVHRHGRIAWVNAVTLSLLGFDREDAMVGHDVFEFVHPDDRHGIRERIRAAVEEGRAAPAIEERFVGAGGRVVTIEAASLPILFHGVPSVVVVGRDVTERSRAEAERRRMFDEQRALVVQVQRQAAEWRGVVSSMADGVWVLDERGKLLAANEAAGELFGLGAEEAMGMSDADLATSLAIADKHGHAIPPGLGASSRALRGEVLRDVEFSFVQRGTVARRHARLSAAPVRIDDRVAGAVLVAHDITAHKEYQAERDRLLLEAEMQRRLFEDIVQNAPAGVAVVSGPDFVFEVVNPAFRTLAPDIEMRGRRFADVAPEMPEVLPILERVMRTGSPERVNSMPLSIQRKEGGPIEEGYFTFAVVRVWNPAGHRLALLGIVVETTEQIRARKKIEELAELAHRSAAELRGVIETMSEAVFTCDADTKLTLANPAAMRLLGVDSLEGVQQVFDQSPGSSRLRHLDGTPLPRPRMPLACALAGETVCVEDEVIVGPNGQREIVMRTNAAAIRDSQGVIVGAVEVAHDITDLVEFDQLKDQFIRIAAHELKTPVAVMKGYAQAMLRMNRDLTAGQRETLGAIDRGADRIHRIVQQLVDVSQLHLGRFELVTEPVDLPDLAASIVRVFSTNAPRHRIRLAEAPRAIVRADRDALARVINELVDNAIRYSPDGGDIDLKISVADGHATLSVRDQGVGIPRAQQERAFQRFFRAHTDTPFDYGGMGVSLYISNEVIHRLGGRMWFESEEEQGSTFYVSLPLAELHEPH